MPTVEKKKIQIRISVPLYSQARMAIEEGMEEAASFNDFVVAAVKEKLRRIQEAQIDEAFARMGSDKKYLQATETVSREFADNDLDTLQSWEK